MKIFKVSFAFLIIGCMHALSAAPQTSQTSNQTAVNKVEAKRFAQLYNSFTLECQRPHKHYNIPNTLHFIWLNGPVPTQHKNLDSWRQFHPGWTIKVWTQADIASLKIINAKALANAKTAQQKSQLLRYEILNQFGGVFVENSIQCLRSFDSLAKSCELFAGIASADNPALLSDGIIGVTAHHPVIRECLFKLRQASIKSPSQNIFTLSFARYGVQNSGLVAPMPANFFFAKNNAITKDTYCIQNANNGF